MERRSLYETWPAEPALTDVGADETVFMDAEVRPNRSLPNTGFLVLMGAIGVMSLSAGLGFFFMGAWPVLGFFGLDVLLVALAFGLSFRNGRRRETIQVTQKQILVKRRTAFGHLTAYRVPCAFTRVEIVGRGEPDVQTRLAHAGKYLVIGAMLSPREREALAEAVHSAVKKACSPVKRDPAQEPGGVHG